MELEDRFEQKIDPNGKKLYTQADTLKVNMQDEESSYHLCMVE